MELHSETEIYLTQLIVANSSVTTFQLQYFDNQIQEFRDYRKQNGLSKQFRFYNDKYYVRSFNLDIITKVSQNKLPISHSLPIPINLANSLLKIEGKKIIGTTTVLIDDFRKIHYTTVRIFFQSLRIIPIDWKQSISLKVSARGCDTQLPSKYFDGGTIVPVTNLNINETLDIKIGFKTFESNGILLRYL